MQHVSKLLPKISKEKIDEEIEIRDMRKKDHFVVDDLFIDVFACLIGPYATLVYTALCRHADYSSQESWPSIELLSEKLKISISSVKRGIERLVEYNIISVSKNRGIQGRWGKNIYKLHDKKHWGNKNTIALIELR